MKLDQIILGIIIAGGVFWLGTLVVTALIAPPWGWLILIPVAVVVGILAVVIYQRVTNKEDNYYERNVDK